MKQNTKRAIIAFIISLLLTLVALLCYAHFKDAGKQGGVEQEPETEQGEVVKNDKGASFDYSGKVSVQRDAKLVKMNFANPIRSTKNISLELRVEINGAEYSFAKKEQMVPGDKIEELPLLYDGSLPSGRFPGEFVLHFYNESGDEEVVNTKLKVDVYIK